MSDHFDHDRDLNEKQLLHKIVGLLQQLINITISGDEAIIAALNPQPKLNDELVLTIPSNTQGETPMGAPASIPIANGPVQGTVVEKLAGVASTTDNGPIAFASDTPSVASVDPVSGLVTPVSAGTANVTALDAIGNISDTVAVTVVGVTPPQQNDSLELTIPSNAPASFRGGSSSSFRR